MKTNRKPGALMRKVPEGAIQGVAPSPHADRTSWKIRCRYCSAEFLLGARDGLLCPKCHRAAILPRSDRPLLKRPRHERPEPGSTVGIPKWGTFSWGGLVQAQRPVMFVFMAATAVAGLVIMMGVFLGWSTFAQVPMLPVLSKTPEKVAERELGVLRIALAKFSLDCKRQPQASEGLTALLNNPGSFTWRGPYVTLLRPDPWGHPYVYRPAGDTNESAVSSSGPDGVEGTADDIRPPPLDKATLESFLFAEMDRGQAANETMKPGMAGNVP